MTSSMYITMQEVTTSSTPGMLWNIQGRISRSQQIGSAYRPRQRGRAHGGDCGRKPQGC